MTRAASQQRAPIESPSMNTEGTIKISYRFGDKQQVELKPDWYRYQSSFHLDMHVVTELGSLYIFVSWQGARPLETGEHEFNECPDGRCIEGFVSTVRSPLPDHASSGRIKVEQTEGVFHGQFEFVSQFIDANGVKGTIHIEFESN